MTRKPLRPLLKRLKTAAAALSRKGLMVAAAVATVGASAYVTHSYIVPGILQHPYFRLRTIKVACDSRAVAPQELALRAGLTAGTTIWQVDPKAAEAALEKPAWVRDAEVVRRFPGQVSLRVFRRSPVAATLTDRGAFLIDADGVVFREDGEGDYPDLPYLTGWLEAGSRGERMARLRTLMGLLEGAVERGYAVSQVDVDDEGNYRLFPETPRIAINFGASPDVDEGLRRMHTVLAALSDSLSSIREVDVNYGERVVVKAAPGGLPTLLMAKAGLPATAGPKPAEMVEAAGDENKQGNDRG